MNRPTLAALILLPIALALNVVADFPPQGGIAGEALSRLGHVAANVLAYISLALVVWGIILTTRRAPR